MRIRLVRSQEVRRDLLASVYNLLVQEDGPAQFIKEDQSLSFQGGEAILPWKMIFDQCAEYRTLRTIASDEFIVLLTSKPNEENCDGLLTASEIAQLKLNADCVVLSAANTAAGDKPGGEALSGLARAFFYAGAHSLIVSNLDTDSTSTVQLMTGTFAALAADSRLSHGEALQKSMLAILNDAHHPQWAEPNTGQPSSWSGNLISRQSEPYRVHLGCKLSL
jgi:hypothetical protein